MKKLAVLCITALGAALLVLGTAPSASAYPELTCSIDAQPQVVNPGDTFTVTGHAEGVDKQGKVLPSSAFSWTFEWNGETKTRAGADVSATFTAPSVTRTRTIPLTARNSSPNGDCIRHLDIKVVGPSAVVSPPTDSGGLPNTGGPAFWLLIAALLLLLGGGGAVVASRRR